jgi:uncharacterized protein YcbK (DUF882 family)
MIGRRPFLLGAAAAAGTAGPSAWKRASAAVAAPERWIWARNQAGEEVAVAYRTGDAYKPQAIAGLRRLLRDLREEVEGPLPPMLVDMLSVVQERWGYTRPLLVGSGYRTLKTNRSLEGAAPASFHLRGWAADISVRGVPPLDLGLAVWTLSQRFGFMGVGLYPGFVHLDVGPRRAWTRFGA